MRALTKSLPLTKRLPRIRVVLFPFEPIDFLLRLDWCESFYEKIVKR